MAVIGLLNPGDRVRITTYWGATYVGRVDGVGFKNGQDCVSIVLDETSRPVKLLDRQVRNVHKLS